MFNSQLSILALQSNFSTKGLRKATRLNNHHHHYAVKMTITIEYNL